MPDTTNAFSDLMRQLSTADCKSPRQTLEYLELSHRINEIAELVAAITAQTITAIDRGTPTAESVSYGVFFGLLVGLRLQTPPER